TMVHAASGGLNGVRGEVALKLDQIAAGLRAATQVEMGVLLVTLFHLPSGEVSQDLRPTVLGIAGDHAVSVLLSFLRAKCGMHAAQYHRNPALTKLTGQKI